MTPITVRLDKGYKTAIHIRQHTLIADEHLEDGGSDVGPTPMEILLGTVGACVAVTTKAYAKHKAWPLDSVSVELDMENFKRADYPAYVGNAPFVNEIREIIHFDGPLTEEQRTRLMDVARKCPVHKTLENPVFFVEKRDDAVGHKT